MLIVLKNLLKPVLITAAVVSWNITIEDFLSDSSASKKVKTVQIHLKSFKKMLKFLTNSYEQSTLQFLFTLKGVLCSVFKGIPKRLKHKCREGKKQMYS